MALGIRLARADGDVAAVKELFLEYASSLGFSLCFQGFEGEMDTFPAKYAEPRGCLLLATSGGAPVGAVGLRDLGGGACEMKRLFVRPEARRTGAGRALAERLVREARERGYRVMRLDTLVTMTAALALYRELGFREIAPYCENPLPEARYLELAL